MTMSVSDTEAGRIWSGPPLATISGLLGGPRVDDLLTRAAERVPGKAALVTADRGLTYAELDAEVSRCASAFAALAGGPGAVIAIPAVLDPVFAVAYFGAARAGLVSAVVNPLLTEQRMLHVLAVADARVAVIAPEMYPRFAAIADRLPALKTVVLTERAPGLPPEAASLPTLGELLDAAPAFAAAPRSPDEQDLVSCLQFTSGTTGAAKAVRLSHRNLTVNAAQTAVAHRLDETSVLFTYLPTFHLMHLTIGVQAMATHVLWTGEDIAGSVEAAEAYRATHYYSLPMRLARLAADPRLAELAPPRLRAILSGGSALSPSVNLVLSQQFGVPVAQGYGLAENSPSTHLSDWDKPKPGSSGLLVAGAQSRIVDIDTRAALPTGAKGEIQLRGPQLMVGYLGRDIGNDVDADGWFSTGDVGFYDEDGDLFVVDRIKDTFKCDNWLVSPTEIERVLLRHPAVADGVVVDVPDEFSGAVAHALVVAASPDADAAAIAAAVNADLPYYEQIRRIVLVDAIERSATGKVVRRDLRHHFA
ncbi:long-chain acyl-CoA synthetase [Amycolatopsis xylanica]|uniref:Long-chain acyl-CoA synthetase n=1 Tax=Amycolatopsis xylanica TaxID=589385 RepID=A0A1H2VTA3_9PSEU|nr:class I adenylate-forming enzyme family protein [Amycolatopsis xylanica]SDW71652.1 long-chain acyl-CoA synthetase [Amycolatopsis xylanica]